MNITTLEFIHELLKAEAAAAETERKEAIIASNEAYPDKRPIASCTDDPIEIRYKAACTRYNRATSALNDFESHEW